MRHDIVLEGFNCRLRPVCEADAPFIIQVRTQERANGNINATSTSVPEQVAWINRYLERANDYYWIIECISTGASIGTIGLYDFLSDGSEAMPGRWVMLSQADVNVMAPIFLMYAFAFERLGIKRLVSSVMPDNRKVLHFHKLLGARPIATPERYAQKEVDSGICQRWFELTEHDWLVMKDGWEPILNDF